MTNLLLQTSGILVPIVLLLLLRENVFFAEKSSRTEKVLLVVLLSASIIACMSYAVPLFDDHFDMRDIPLFLGILYGGYDVGSVLTAVAVVFRFFIGGVHGVRESLDSTLIHAIVLPVVFWARYRYFRQPNGKRTLVGTGLGFLLSVVATIVSVMATPALLQQPDIARFYLVFIASNTFGLTFLIGLIEKTRENEVLRQELHEADKLKVVSQLAASVAHEVRNPLTVIGGFVKLLVETDLDAERKKTYGVIVSQELARAQSIITDYLTFARPEVEASEYVCVNLRDDVVVAVNMLQPFAITHNVTLTMELTGNMIIETHREKFVQALVNIMKNGIEAMHDGGSLTVRLVNEGDTGSIYIRDEGVGMTHEQMRLLGNPFYSLKDKGTGLGLMVSYRIIQSIGGRITVQSTLGKGTEFRIRIPIKTAAEMGPEVVGDSAEPLEIPT